MKKSYQYKTTWGLPQTVTLDIQVRMGASEPSDGIFEEVILGDRPETGYLGWSETPVKYRRRIISCVKTVKRAPDIWDGMTYFHYTFIDVPIEFGDTKFVTIDALGKIKAEDAAS